MRGAIEHAGGHIFQVIGDAFCAAFHKPGDALHAAIQAQQDLQNEPWDTVAIRVRMGIHTGEAEPVGEEYRGYLALSLVQRVMSAGHGGQVLASDASEPLLRDALPLSSGLRDMGAHTFKGTPFPVRLFQVVAPGLLQEFPPLRTPDTLPNNLPVQITSFVGREKQLADVKNLLHDAHLLTLIGPGGTGKTRLSIRAASELLDYYPAGVWLVELAPILDPLLVPRTTAIAVGLRDEPQRPVIDMLCDYLKDKKLLILLDNCEHLVDACARMADRILRGAPDVRILASSREPLAIAGEVTYRVPSLGLPDLDHLPPVETLSQYEAVKLFIDRALAALPNFTVSNENAPALAEICHHLDGIPLAIELAAAKVRVLSLEQIAARLGDRFRLLTGGSRTALEHHQTLRATIDWSFNLLPPPEQVLFRRLSAFVGGWTLEAAEFVCAGGSVGSEDVLDLMEQLVNKSLVVAEEAGHASRYHMLETIRQYGQEKLAAEDMPEQIHNRHLGFFLQLAEQAETELNGSGQVAWLRRLDADRDNLRESLRWSLAAGTTGQLGGSPVEDLGLRLAGSLWKFWELKGFFTEGRSWLEKMLARGSDAPSSARAKALTGAGTLAWHQADLPQAAAYHEAARDTYEAIHDSRGVAFALNNVAMQYLDQALYDHADHLFKEALERYWQLGDSFGIGVVLNNMGSAARNRGDAVKAAGDYQESLKHVRQTTDKRLLAILLMNMGELAQDHEDFEGARARYEESLSLFEQFGEESYMADWVLRMQGYLALVQGDVQRAARICRQRIQLCWESGDKNARAESVEFLAQVLEVEGDLETSARLFSAADGLRKDIGVPLPPAVLPAHRRVLDRLQDRLGQDAFSSAWAAGGTIAAEGWDRVAVFALAESPAAPPPS